MRRFQSSKLCLYVGVRQTAWAHGRIAPVRCKETAATVHNCHIRICIGPVYCESIKVELHVFTVRGGFSPWLPTPQMPSPSTESRSLPAVTYNPHSADMVGEQNATPWSQYIRECSEIHVHYASILRRVISQAPACVAKRCGTLSQERE